MLGVERSPYLPDSVDKSAEWGRLHAATPWNEVFLAFKDLFALSRKFDWMDSGGYSDNLKSASDG